MEKIKQYNEVLKLKELKPTLGNPQKMTKEQFSGLVKSMKKNGWLLDAPVVWEKAENEYQIVSGHHRIKAGIEAGIEETSCKILTGLTEGQAKLLLLEANQRKGELNQDDLISFVDKIINEYDYDIDMVADEVGFYGDDIYDILTKKEPEEEDDIIPEVPEEAKSKLGDIVVLGKHRILCGDCTEKNQVSVLMDGKDANMVFTDPPYNVAYCENKNHPTWKNRLIINDNQSNSEWVEFNNKLSVIFKEYCIGDFYMWGASGYDGMKARCIFIENGLHWSATIIWKKNRLVLSPSKYQRMYEPCLYGWFNRSSFKGDRKNVEVWEIDRPSASKLHPTMKPIELCVKAITLSSGYNDIVMDLFLGSGSTLISCEKTSRICYGMEISENYIDVIIKRYVEYKGSHDNCFVIRNNEKISVKEMYYQ